jgi:hypothetical protein
LSYNYHVDGTIDLQVGISHLECDVLDQEKLRTHPMQLLHDDAVCNTGIRGRNLRYKL